MSLDVLIPHYRDVIGLAESLASVGEQTWTGDIRIVIVDDGSPEKEFRAIRRLLANQDIPFVVERNQQNRGRPYTRNRLLDHIDSDYVAWLDAGDVWYPEKLTLQFEHLNRLRFTGADTSGVWVTCNYDWQRDGGRCRQVNQEVESDQLRELLLGQRLRCYLWTILAPADTFRIIGKFDEQLPRLQDVDYFIRFVRAGGMISNPPYRGALCRYNKSDLGRSAREIRQCNRKIFEKHRPCFQQYGSDFLAAVQFNAEILSARYAKNNADVMNRMYYIARAFGTHPQLAFDRTRRWAAQFRG